MKYISIIIVFLILSCNNKETVMLPKSDISLVTDISDYSVVYFFFKETKKDTLVTINKNNLISTTNWVFNIDKRLPIKIVIPELLKLQTKKKNNEAHKNENAQNYFSYADTVNKRLAFKNITNITYHNFDNQKVNFIFIDKNNKIKFENKIVSFEILNEILRQNRTKIFSFCFDKNMSFQNYLKNTVAFEKLKQTYPNKISNSEYIY